MRIGIAIATYNSEAVIERCLVNLAGGDFDIVIFDDGSTDRTVQLARKALPSVKVLFGDGDSWWGGGTARAVKECFSRNCGYVLMLNPDAFISARDVCILVDYAKRHPGTIPAALVVADGNEDTVAWAGSLRIKLWGLPVYSSRYIAKRGSPISKLGLRPYETHEVHGRGVVISRSVYDRIGTLESKVFPHYGADTDYSLRALASGIAMVILPEVKVRLAVEQSGMAIRTRPFSVSRLVEVWNFLTKRKNGEHIYVLWNLSVRHLPLHAVLPSFLFNLFIIITRRLL